MQQDRKLLTPRQFQAEMPKIGDKHAIGLRTVYRSLKTGRLRSVNVNGRFLIPVSEVEDFISRESGQPEQKAA